MGSRYDDPDDAGQVATSLGEAARQSRRGGRWLFLMIALMVFASLLAVFGLMIVFRGSSTEVLPDPQASLAASPPADAPAPGTDSSRWLLSGDGHAMYTVEIGTEASGPVVVLEDATATGAYEWSGSTLTIDFRRILTMTDNAQFEDPWRFVCTGSRDADSLACVGTKYGWSYDPRTGLDPGAPEDFDVTATRQ